MSDIEVELVSDIEVELVSDIKVELVSDIEVELVSDIEVELVDDEVFVDELLFDEESTKVSSSFLQEVEIKRIIVKVASNFIFIF
ncbi:MAG: hypothetical protein CMD18_07350 [Flavobacteriales bacterium]|nr:hypothetical protein [Flavobacteriales bacterium]